MLLGVCIALPLEVKCIGLSCQSDLLGFFIAIGSQVGKNLQPTKKTPNHPNKKKKPQKNRKATS